MSIENARHRVNAAIEILETHIPAGRLQGSRFLDIGCGTGNGVIAALKLGAQVAIGIDRDANEFGYSYFSELASEFQVDERAATLIQANLFDMRFFDGGFDICLMYDSIEHVPRPENFVQACADALRPGGIGLILTCPLYYGPVGHHLWHVFPETTMPWAHLYYEFETLLADADVGPWHAQRFRELNKVTHSQLLGYLDDSKLSLVEDKSISHERFLDLLQRFKHRIDFSLVPSVEDLLRDYVSLLFRKN